MVDRLITAGAEALHLARAMDGQGSSDELMMAMDERVTKIVLDAVREAVAHSPELLEELAEPETIKKAASGLD